MKKNQFLMVVCSAVLLFGCASAPLDINAPVSNDELLYNEIYESDRKDILVVYVSGDTGKRKGKDSRYFFREAQRTARKYGVTSVSLLRPGTYDKYDNKSIGYQDESDDNKTKKNNFMVARTINYLKKKTGASKVIGVGHSGGAIMLSVIIGEYPDLLDAVVLASSACDIPKYRIKRRGRNTWKKSQSPKNFVDGVSSDTVIRIVTGENDTNTLPEFAEDCHQRYKARGLDSSMSVVDGGAHNFRSIKHEVRNQLKNIIEN